MIESGGVTELREGKYESSGGGVTREEKKIKALTEAHEEDGPNEV